MATTYIYGAGYDETLRQLDTSGAEQWSFNSWAGNAVQALAADSDGNVYAATGEYDNSAQDFRKFDTSGSEAWKFTNFVSEPRDIAVGPNGNIYFVVASTGGHKLYKLDSSGSKQWDTNTADYPKAVTVDHSRDRIWVGGTNGVQEYKPDGTATSAQWTGNNDAVRDLEVGPNGNIYPAVNHYDGQFVKLDSSGSVVWEKIGGSFSWPDDEINGIAVAPDGSNLWYGDASSNLVKTDNPSSGTKPSQQFSKALSASPRDLTYEEGALYAGVASSVREYDPSDGSENWSASLWGNDVLAVTATTVTSSNTAPTADFTFTKNGGTVDFTDQSSDPDGSISSWSWDFGDGNTSTQQSPSHTYSSSGTYTVTLTVTDDDGATGNTSQNVTVSITVGGTASVTDKGQSSSITGDVTASGTGVTTDKKQTASGSGDVTASGTAALTDKGQTINGIEQPTISGSLSATDKGQTISAAGDILTSGTAALTDKKTMISTAADAPAGATAALTDKKSSLSGTVDVVAGATADVTDKGQTIDAVGDVLTSGSSSLTDQGTWIDGVGKAGAPGTKQTAPNLFHRRDPDSGDDSLVKRNTTDFSVEWEHTPSGSNGEISIGRNPKAAADGDVYFTLSDNARASLVKLDSSGTKKWEWDAANNGYDGVSDFVLRPDGRVVVEVYDSGNNRVDLVEIDGSGTAQASTEILPGLSGTPFIDSMTVDRSSNVYWTTDDPDPLVLKKFGADLTEQWSVSHSISGLFNLDVTPDGLYGRAFADDFEVWRWDKSSGNVDWKSPKPEGSGPPSDARTLREVQAHDGAVYVQYDKTADENFVHTVARLEDTGSGLSYVWSEEWSGDKDIRDTKVGEAGNVFVIGDRTSGGRFDRLDPETGQVESSADINKKRFGFGLQAPEGGVVAFTNGKESMSAAGTVSNTGSLAAQNKGETLSAVGGPSVVGFSSTTDQQTMISADGDPITAAAGSLTDNKQSLSSDGNVTAGGSLALTDKQSVITIVGDVIGGGIGDLAFTDGKTTLSVEGGVPVVGSAQASDQRSSLSGNIAVLAGGSSSLTDQTQTLALSGDVLAGGTGAFTDKPTLINADGDVLATASGFLSLVDALPNVSADGGPVAGGSLALTDALHLLSIDGTPVAGGSGSLTSKPELIGGQGGAIAGSTLDLTDEKSLIGGDLVAAGGGAVQVTDSGQQVTGSGDVITAGSLSTEDARQTFNITIFVGRKPDAINASLNSTIVLDASVQATE